MSQVYDDSDMKIVGAPKAPERESEYQGFLAESSRQHFNGNIAKARTLGSNIVSSFSYKAAPAELVDFVMENGVVPTEDVLLQIRFLSVFSAELSINSCLPPLLAQIAKSEMYDVLMQFSPDFYDALARSGAFSFYYMALHKGVVTAENVGRQFAMLCGHEDDEAFITLGRKLHELNLSVYRKAIDGFVFV